MNNDPHNWRIMAVDNELDSLNLMERLLKHRQINYCLLSSGEQCLAQIDKYQPTILLLDIQMPVLSGWQVISLLRSDPHWETLPIIAVTAHAMHGDRERLLKAGFTEHFAKPISARKLIEQIQETLNKGEQV